MKYNALNESTSGLGSRIQDVYDISKKKLDKYSTIYGEIGKPESFDTSFRYVSHVVNDVSLNTISGTNSLLVDIKPLDTQYGKILKEMMMVGMPLNLSARASGIRNADGTVEVKDVFSYDFSVDTNGGSEYISRKILAEQRKKKIDIVLGEDKKDE